MLRLSDFRALRVTLLHAQKSPPKLRRLTKTENALPKRPTNSKSTELGIWHSSMMFDKNFSDRLILYTKSAEASNRLFKLTTFGQVVFLAGLAFMGYNHQQIEHLRIEALQEEYRLQQQEKEKLKAGTIDDDKHDEIQKTS